MQAIRAMRLVAVAQHLSRMEASKRPLAQEKRQTLSSTHRRNSSGRRGRAKTAAGAALQKSPTGIRRSGGSIQSPFVGNQLESISQDSQTYALIGARISVLRSVDDNMQSFCKVVFQNSTARTNRSKCFLMIFGVLC